MQFVILESRHRVRHLDAVSAGKLKEQRMPSRSLSIRILIATMLLSTSCASARTTSERPRMPAELRGTWEGGVATCKLPGNPDSDARIIIGERKIEGYEDWSDVIKVAKISTEPAAWKVMTKLHMYEDVVDIVEIFLLSGEDRGELTIVNQSQSNAYRRCL